MRLLGDADLGRRLGRHVERRGAVRRRQMTVTSTAAMVPLVAPIGKQATPCHIGQAGCGPQG